VAKQKLDLVQFSPGVAAQAGAGPTQVMRGQVFNGCSFSAVLYDMPHGPLRYTLSPCLACSANAPKDAAFVYASGHKPRIDGALDPVGNGDRSDVPAFANQINDSPVVLPTLEKGDVQFCRLSPAQPAT